MMLFFMEAEKRKKLETDFFILNFKLYKIGSGKRCHENSRILASALRKKGHDVRVVDGLYLGVKGKMIKHSWIEYEDLVLETDPEQLGIKSRIPYAVLDRKDYIQEYEEEDIDFSLELNDEEIDKIASGLVEKLS